MEAAGDMHNGYTCETGGRPPMLQNSPRNRRLSVARAVHDVTRSESEDERKQLSMPGFSAEAGQDYQPNNTM